MTTEASAVSEADTEGKQKSSGAEPEADPENQQTSGAAASEPEGEPSSKKTGEKVSEPGSADAATSPEEEQLKPRTRTSAGKGLSRLFSSFLKRRSQCSEGEGFEVEKAQEEKGEESEKKEEEKGKSKGKKEEKEVKAPIAAPEPELKTEPDVEPTPDQHSVSSGETQTWLEPAKEIRKQVPGAVYEFTFNVKFYPPDPAQLTEDLTRYYLCAQLRKDIMLGVLPCSFVTLSLLGSYTAQSEVGEYDPELHGTDYVKDLNLAPGQSKELEEKVMELHRTYRSMSPAQADLLFLENAKKLAMYGVDLHQAKDLDGVDITLGVCSSGLMVYKDKLRINRFPWPKVLKISYKRSSFFIKIRPSEQEQYESTIGFKLPNYKASKKLWKVCVEHHTFFRLPHPVASWYWAPSSGTSGRTQAQTRQASSMIDRPAPRFTRSAKQTAVAGARPVSAPVFSQAALLEAGIPLAPLDQPQTSTPIKTSRQEERKLEVTVESVEPSKIETVAEDKEFDKPQEDLLKHHANISELKRNFMEAVPESRPSEWDKRLSTHSPFRTLGINGQPLPSADGVRVNLF
uniref:Protein 4.1 n=1 Tax=Gouania willdenowi TaxID=441366 RepID=A0A8C5DF65_GOUWI